MESMSVSEAVAHCPRKWCLSSDLWRVSDSLLQCNDCGLAFNVEEAVVGVDPRI